MNRYFLHALTQPERSRRINSFDFLPGARGDLPDASGRTVAEIMRRKRDPKFHRLADRLATGVRG